MLSLDQPVQTLDELRSFITHRLCQYDELDPHVFPVSESVLVRGARPCGMFFCLHGPRRLKCTAVWETDRNQVLFYDSRGERCQTVQLAASIKLESN